MAAGADRRRNSETGSARADARPRASSPPGTPARSARPGRARGRGSVRSSRPVRASCPRAQTRWEAECRAGSPREEREPPVLRQQHVPMVRVGVVDALEPGPGTRRRGRTRAPGERRARARARAPPRPGGPGQLQDERALGHVRLDHARHDERVEPLHEPSDELRVMCLLDEIELAAKVQLELLELREPLELDPLRSARSAELPGEPSSAAPRGRARVVSRPR